jgi:hypothetical protein
MHADNMFLWKRRRIGMTGNGAQRDSTMTNRIPETTLTPKSATIRGSVQARLSVDCRLQASRKHPTAPTNVAEPARLQKGQPRAVYSDKLLLLDPLQPRAQRLASYVFWKGYIDFERHEDEGEGEHGDLQ